MNLETGNLTKILVEVVMKKRRRYKNKKKKNLRSGSQSIRKQLIAENPHCDMCNAEHPLELHHIYLTRHGFQTQKDHCVLLCANCHRDFHKRWDKYLDITFQENPHADFLRIYQTLKKL